MFRLNQLEYLIPSATKIAEDDREKFIRIYNIIEKHISTHNMIVGGNWGIKLLLNDPREIDDYSYELYSENAEQDAFAISNEISKHETNFVSLKQELNDYVVYVESRSMLIIHQLVEHDRGIIQPLQITYKKYKYNILPADYHLLELYRALYLPLSDNWETAIEHENQLFDMVKYEYNKNQRKYILGGDEETQVDESTEPVESVDPVESIDSENTKKIRDGLQHDLLLHLVKRKDIILVGEYACYLLTGKKVTANHLHIVATTSIAHELNSWIKSKVNLKTFVKINKIKLHSDRRLIRATVYIIVGSAKYPVLYVYNSLEYDLIPFNIGSYQVDKTSRGLIGNPYVILRFLLIEIWIIKIIREMGGIDTKFSYGKILDLYTLIFSIRTKLKMDENTVGSEETNLWGIFNTPELRGHRYLGIYFSDAYFKKQLMRKKFIRDYTPAGYYNQTKKYAKDFNDISV